MGNLYTLGAACPILWVLAIVEFVRGVKFASDYTVLHLSKDKSSSIRSFFLFAVLVVFAAITTAMLLSVMKEV